jgi:hypothetical protein
VGIFLLLVLANIAAFVIYKRFHDRDALNQLRLPAIIALVCGAVGLVAAGEAPGGGQLVLAAVFLHQLWWGSRDVRIDPNKPGEPARVASASSAVLILGSFIGAGILTLPDPRGSLLIFIAGAFG